MVNIICGMRIQRLINYKVEFFFLKIIEIKYETCDKILPFYIDFSFKTHFPQRVAIFFIRLS